MTSSLTDWIGHNVHRFNNFFALILNRDQFVLPSSTKVKTGKISNNWLNIKIPSKAPILLSEEVSNNLLKSNGIVSKLTLRGKTFLNALQAGKLFCFMRSYLSNIDQIECHTLHGIFHLSDVAHVTLYIADSTFAVLLRLNLLFFNLIRSYFLL